MMSCGVERETLGFHLYLILFWGKPNMQFLNLETFLKMITLVKIELKEIYCQPGCFLSFINIR